MSRFFHFAAYHAFGLLPLGNALSLPTLPTTHFLSRLVCSASWSEGDGRQDKSCLDRQAAREPASPLTMLEAVRRRFWELCTQISAYAQKQSPGQAQLRKQKRLREEYADRWNRAREQVVKEYQRKEKTKKDKKTEKQLACKKRGGFFVEMLEIQDGEQERRLYEEVEKVPHTHTARTDSKHTNTNKKQNYESPLHLNIHPFLPLPAA